MQRFELVERGSRKFWEISLEGPSFTTHWGRLGTAGQSKTKTFPDAETAKKEHDKLVAEKLKHGYVAVAASAGEASGTERAKGGGASEPDAMAASPASPNRRDVFLDNDSGGFAILSAGVVDRVIEDGRSNDEQFVKANEVILANLVGDDSFIVRVVVGEALTKPEAEEWIARIRWPLVVSGGKLLIAGGFDPDCLAGWRDDGEGGMVREVPVPDGKYLASVYTYLHTMNGRVFLEREWDEKLGAWFRRDHPKRAFPSWVAGELARSPDDDPGHEEQWENLAASVKSKKLRVETEPLDWVGFLVHLEPFDAKAELSKPGEDGWFEDATGLRRPAKCPLGIPARGAEDSEYRSELDEILPKSAKKQPPPRHVKAVDVAARVADRPMTPVRGGPVEHPISKLVQVYRLAWLATDAADPEIRISPSDPGYQFQSQAPIEGVAVKPIEAGLSIGFESGGAKWAQLSAVGRVAERLGSLPDGSTLELMTAHAPDPEQHRDLGVHRYRGEVRKGTWRISETFPALDRELLQEALAFSSAIDAGKELPLHDAAEGARALELSKEDASLFRRNPIVVKEGTIGLTEADDGLLHFVATYVFRTRWPTIWPCWVEPEEDARARQEAQEKLAAMSKKLAESLAKAATPKGPRELILEGKAGRFDRIDLARERAGESELIASTDKQLEALGYQPLGDLQCSRFPDVLIRGYGREGGDTWGLLMSGSLKSSFDFVTRFESGAGLTTTRTGGMSMDEPAKGVFRSRFPEIGLNKLAKLHAEHRKRTGTLSKDLGAPVVNPATLRALAEAIDRGVCQQLGIS